MKSKGFTLIELLVCFALITVISISMFRTVLSLQKTQQKNVMYNKYVAFTSSLNETIQRDFLTKTMTSFESCNSNCYDIGYEGESTIRLSMSKSNNTITYGDTMEEVPVGYTIYGDLDVTHALSLGKQDQADAMLTIKLPIKETSSDKIIDITYVYQYNSENFPIITSISYGNAISVIKGSGNMMIDGTDDTNLRYSGTNPNNYVAFNDEIWRIMGIFNVSNGSTTSERIKLISPTIGIFSYDSSPTANNQGYGYNIWETKEGQTKEDGTTTSDLNDLLNKLYLNDITTVTCYRGENNTVVLCPPARIKNDTTRGMIDSVVWNLGGIGIADITDPTWGFLTVNSYNDERGKSVYWSAIAKTEWIGKVGLMYPSDYGYASTNSECRANLRAGATTAENWYENVQCKNENWLHNGGSIWSMSPQLDSNSNMMYILGYGLIHTSWYSFSGLEVKPVVYLNSNVKITSGIGTSDNPYVLSN